MSKNTPIREALLFICVSEGAGRGVNRDNRVKTRESRVTVLTSMPEGALYVPRRALRNIVLALQTQVMPYTGSN
jgi:hypothetical protein